MGYLNGMGDSATFQEYEETALQWEQGIAYHKRYLAGPRLVAELSGSARKHVMGKRPEWLMLIDAGLDSTSRNMAQTAPKDQQNKGTAYLQDEVDAVEEEWPDAWVTDDLTEEAQALFGAAEKEAQEAYAMMQQGRRTLREARARQHQMRLNRQYYKNTFSKDKDYGGRSSHSQNGSTTTTCLRCGKQHRTTDCPCPGTSPTGSKKPMLWRKHLLCASQKILWRAPPKLHSP